jgi:hypothetical protein
MGKFAATKIRNICLCGHGSSGKTMLAEAMLYKTGATTRLGSVSEGSSVLDYADDEKERQYSINLSIAYVKWQDVLIQVVDTPGYPDFIGETISGLSAVETAVVTIDTSSGIKVNTHRPQAGRVCAAGCGGSGDFRQRVRSACRAFRRLGCEPAGRGRYPARACRYEAGACGQGNRVK